MTFVKPGSLQYLPTPSGMFPEITVKLRYVPGPGDVEIKNKKEITYERKNKIVALAI